MDPKTQVENIYRAQTESFSASPEFQALEKGTSDQKTYKAFLANVAKTHMQSPKLLAFLYTIVPPNSSEAVKHNLLEELGLEDSEESHPDLLAKVIKAGGFDQGTLEQLEKDSQEEIRQMCSDPMMYGTIKEFGLHIMLEVFSFEWMLSRLATRIGNFLAKYCGYTKDELLWFYFHSEKDIQHAQEALDTITDYVNYYQISEEDLTSIIDATFRENVYLKHYFSKRSAV